MKPHSPHPSYSVRQASWQRDHDTLCRIREQVFIKEQHVPVELEWDGEDEAALHLLAENEQGNAVGTARMLLNGHIGRVAVLRPWRGCGVGTLLVKKLLQQALERGWNEVHLDAQVDALPFYQQLGFVAEGEIFMDAGIPHRHMWLKFEAGHISG